MGTREFVPITFEGGLFSYWDDAQIPAGSAQTLENWVPEGTGSLRSRVGWVDSSTTGAAATRRVKGMGYFVPSAGAKLLVAHDDNTDSLDIYHIPFATLASGTWTLLEAMPVTDRTLPVAFAAGAGKLLHSHPGYLLDRIRTWDGTTLADASTELVAGRALIYHKNRFFSGGGDQVPTRVYYSELGDATFWDDDPGGNYFFDVAADDGEPVEDFVTFDNGIVIGKESSLWFLSGAGPDTFALHPLGRVDCAPGRSLVTTPSGVVIAGRRSVWLWSGSDPRIISRPIANVYSISGGFVTTSYVDNVVYIADRGTGVIWCWDTERNIWYKELSDNADHGPASVFAKSDTLIGGAKQSTTNSFVMYRTHPAGARERDADLPVTFRATTGDTWLAGPQQPVTIHRLWLKIRQRGTGQSDEDPLEIKIYKDGVEARSRNVQLREDAGVFSERIDLGVTGYALRLDMMKSVATTETGLLDIEEILAEVEIERTR